ncbi:MAG: glutamate-cysteine ligase family protein [Asgard group archaeon]|nr:glutamate-cysteine ligase family protein [Asgard group archaeon]
MNSQNKEKNLNKKLFQLPFSHGIEIENFITTKRGDILEEGKILVDVWDQMFSDAYTFLKGLQSSSAKIPNIIKKKIKKISKKKVERHGKTIQYIQMEYKFNGKISKINIFGPDPNISQITWLLELVTPPCEYLEELEWWIRLLYQAATKNLKKGHFIQPIGFNPYQKEYRAGVTCGEHHHLGNFQTKKERMFAYNMIRAFLPHLIAISNTSPFVEGRPTGRTVLKKGKDGRTLILAPDCVRSFRLRENTGQLGPNIPDYLPYATNHLAKNVFSKHVRKEIPDDRYVDLYPFTDYETIECRFFDTQYDSSIRRVLILLLQALALKGVNLAKANQNIPEIKGNTIFEHRKRVIDFGLFAKFQGDSSLKGNSDFVNYYNFNPETGGPPGKIYESLISLLKWLQPEFQEMGINDSHMKPLLIMLFGTSNIAPPISPATFLFYLFERNHNNIISTMDNINISQRVPNTLFSKTLGEPLKNLKNIYEIQPAQSKTITDHSKTSLAKKLQQDAEDRKRKIMTKQKARLEAKRKLRAKIKHQKLLQLKKEQMLRKKRKEKLQESKKPKPKPVKIPGKTSSLKSQQKKPSKKPVAKSKPSTRKKASIIAKTRRRSKPKKKPKITTSQSTRKRSNKSPPVRKTKTRSSSRKTAQAYASTYVKPKRKQTSGKQYISQRTRVGKRYKTIFDEKETFRERSIIRKQKVINFPKKTESDKIIPMIYLKWKNIIFQSQKSFQIKIEAEITPLPYDETKTQSAHSEIFTLEQESLRKDCTIPIPLKVSHIDGDFHVRFLLKDVKKRKIIAILSHEGKHYQEPKNNRPIITGISLPKNQAGKTKVKVTVRNPRRNLRGKLIIWAISQRGKVKLHEHKKRRRTKQFTVNIPIRIPLSLSSTKWSLVAEYQSRKGTAINYVRTRPSLRKIVSCSFQSKPPLRRMVKEDFECEIRPNLSFRESGNIKSIEIWQIIDNKKAKILKKYKVKKKIAKGKKLRLESFTWSPPSLRKWLIFRYDERVVQFEVKIRDNVGYLNNSVVDSRSLPRIIVSD